MVAVLCDAQRAPGIRKALNNLVLPGQRRIHMVKESKNRRKQITAKVTDANLQVLTARSNLAYEPDARNECLTALVRLCIDMNVDEMVLELDESFESSDKLAISRALSGKFVLSYRHESPYREPLLWAADVFAWNAGKGLR